ncbi:kinase-like domain-containing protein [Cubamyces lactineus]|nr:kinase-like domain-containing protein [Cubamyces lactineus]
MPMGDTKVVPPYFFQSPEASKRTAELTLDGAYDLTPSEVRWRDRFRSLKSQGYDLRPRYSPKWKPSWMDTNLDPEFCEDAIMSSDPYVMDAKRQSDGLLVAMKSVKKDSQELQIARFLTSLEHRENHCVEVVDVLEDSLDATCSIMVMRYLRPFDDPEFVMVGDVIDFVSQMLEGLAFLHRQRIAHRDIAPPNIMMDGRALYPNGHHPVWTDCSPDIVEELKPLLRMDHPVKYFYIDFGLSVRFEPDASPYVVGDVGRDAEVPELSSTVPYDAFKADIYALGNLFDKEFVQYHSLDFLCELVDAMKRRQPSQRPTAVELIEIFQKARKKLTPSTLRWRLSLKSQPAYERLFNDTVAAAKDGLSRLRRFVRPT